MKTPRQSKSTAIETSHEDMIHDAQLDYYGKRLATCSSDRTIKVFDLASPTSATAVTGSTQKTHTLTGHTGPVWQVAWAHPKYGSILASCSYDGKVLIWKESTPSGAGAGSGKWTTIKEHSLHTASVNSIAWAPHELGAILACASSDGRVSVLTFKNDGTWDASLFTAHATGCNAISWSPSVLPGTLIVPQARPGNAGPGQAQAAYPTPIQRFITAGSDNTLKIWILNTNTAASPSGSFSTPGFEVSTPSVSNPSATWVLEETLEAHTDWVRDVAWAPNVGLPRSYIASCGQDRKVFIWTKDGEGKGWEKVALDAGGLEGNTNSEGGKFPSVVWRVSWSLAGNILAVSCADGKVSLWKENLKGIWECVSEMDS
ncbi:WD40 repeat-like protein [Serendipita vermifera]|nr:WD40 repeat-like protein [Serendipita vermifera]